MKHNNVYTNQESEDAQISKVMNSIYESIDIPDEEAAHHLFEKRLARAKIRSSRFRIIRTGIAIAACSILIIAFTGQAKQSYAFSNLFDMAKRVQEGVVNLIYGSKAAQNTIGAKTTPPPDFVGQKSDNNQPDSNSAVVQPEETSLKNAARKLAFPLLVPQTLPTGYSLKRSTIYPGPTGDHEMIRIEYVNTGGDILLIVEKKMNDNGSSWQTTVNSDVGTIKEVKINGRKGQLIAYKEGGIHLEWLTGDTVIQVHGNIAENEIIDVSNSFR